ncbi:capsid protein [Escherichia coli]|nr:capsid protein [Escherichia coli]EFL0513108.1 capsid protein [Escherichia coli]EGJ6012395.1 capsid protein [Escherichia coli]
MSVYTTAELLASTQHHFKFDPLFLRLFFRETYPFTTEKVYLSQIPGLVNMALYVSPIVSGEVIRSRGGSTSEFTPGYVKPKHEVNPQMTLRRLPDEDPQNLADPAYRRRRIIRQNMLDENLAIAQVEEMQAVSAVLKGKYTMAGFSGRI